MSSNIFVSPIHSDLRMDLRESMYPTRLWAHSRGETHINERGSCFFGYVVKGEIQIKLEHGSFTLGAGMYFSQNTNLTLSGDGEVVVVERVGFRGLNSIGGPVEDHGRLVYIDNCRSTLLVSPPRLGDPCLNLLTFPKHTQQTMHIHPTVRVGVVASGQGFCVQPNGQSIPLHAGLAFVIPEGVQHCFHTHAEEMSVIAYHPDSDWGPTDEVHPMLNRTFIK